MLFSPVLSISKEVKPSPGLTFEDKLFPPHRLSRKKIVVESRRLSRFPAKMTQVHAGALLSIEEISYS